MPAFSSTSLLDPLVSRNAAAANATSGAFKVVCAWPVSGQYGPGSRVLYYVLIATCVFARKAVWLRNACLAAALLFPAVAALHGIVLAAIHVPGAVDMDVYGAFQLCSIGILAAPVTVRLSRTYFYDPGRNTIFLWTGLILAGLLSLTIEFYRINTSNCAYEVSGKPVALSVSGFPYGISCGLTCTVAAGPFSPIRGGSANNIYVIPAPDRLTFDTATLIAAACCIPAILSLISMWNKILEINWRTRRGENERIDELIDGTNGATVGKMKGVNSVVRLFLSTVEIPFFVAAVLAILILGERNFFSPQVWYQTEPIASIGQWAPIVGTGLAVIGSLNLLRAGKDVEKKESPVGSVHHQCNCSTQQADTGPFAASSNSIITPGATNLRHSFSHGDSGSVDEIEIVLTTSEPLPPPPRRNTRASSTSDVGNRRKIAKMLTAAGNYLGTAAPGRFDDSEFKRGKAVDFPEIPGEEQRNGALRRIRERYNPSRGADGFATPIPQSQNSRAGSINGSIASGIGDNGSSPTSRAASPRRLQAGTLPAEKSSFELQNPPSSLSPGLSGERPRQRRNTLAVPPPVHHSHSWNNPLTSSNADVNIPQGLTSPSIVISSDVDRLSPSPTPVSKTPASSSTSEPPQKSPTASSAPAS